MAPCREARGLESSMCQRNRWRFMIGVGVVFAIAGLAGCASPAKKQIRYLESGKRYLAKKEYQSAVLQFRNASRFNPKDPEPYYQIAMANLGMGNAQQAVFALRKAEAADPGHVPTQRRLSELMAAGGAKENVEDAQRRILAILAGTPNDADALTTLALTQIRLGGRNEAEASLRKALETSPKYLRASMLLADLKLSQNDPNAAEAVLRNAAQKDPASTDAVMALGLFYELLRRYPEAEAQFNRALAADKKSPDLLLRLGAVQSAAGETAQAEETYRKLAALPEKAHRTAYVEYLLQQKKTGAAIAELQALARRDPDDRSVRSLLIRLYVGTGRIQDATAILSAALVKNPKDTDALLARARIRVAAGQYEDAQRDLL